MNVRIQYNMNFFAGIFHNGNMHMNSYNLGVAMTTNSTDPANHSIAFERIKYFVYNELDSTIFINSKNQEGCQQFVDAGLSITTLPGEPVDQLLGIMLYYKLNAIMEDRIIVNETELSSAAGEGIVYLHSENENTESIIKPDWWVSPDLVHSDIDLTNSDKVVTMHPLGVWRDLELAWPDTVDDPKTDNTVVFADFKKDDTN